MNRTTLHSFILILSLLLISPAAEAKPENPPLEGRIISSITKKLVRLHYSQQPLDDSVSETMLKMYLNQMDPNHYMFLQEDVEEFSKDKHKMDDYLEKGDVSFALHVFRRFKTRLSQRLEELEAYLKQDIDFQQDAEWLLDRKDEPFPQSLKEAKELWRTKATFDLLTLTLAGNSMDEAKDRLLRRVRSAWKDYSKFTENDMVSIYLNALASSYDPHSMYMAPEAHDNFEIGIKLSLEGIGAVLRWEDGYTVVNSIVPGGAAARNGQLKVDDRIISVAQGEDPFESVIDMRLNDVVQLIRGKRGTQVRLQVLRKTKSGMETLTIAIIRDKIILKDQEAKSVILEPIKSGQIPNDDFHAPKDYKMGYIRLPSFYIDFKGYRENPNDYRGASRDVKNILLDFNKNKVDGVVLDLRSNGGGGLEEVISMAGLFIGRNPVVMVRHSSGSREVRHSTQSLVYSGPLMILTNRYSASASEILAGAMRDYQRAILVGDKTTFGKGTVQNIIQLPDGYGALKVTIAQFYRVSGGSTQNKGVEVDIVLPSLNNHWEIGESELQNALPWKKISPIPYQPVLPLGQYMPQLRTQSEKRVTNSKFFQQVNEDIQEYLTKIKPRKTTSLKKLQEDRKKEQERNNKAKPETVKNAEEEPAQTESDKHGVFEGKDPYLEEAIFIMEDYIWMTQKS